ncbi:hypothetical protein [Paenibacillus sp. HJGM_3]|uniref:hypothetical protein n=1 Tax=Paenibacillus sp. HJGM_3 TaxID=3379816 RepID=UPI00385F65F6
MSNPIPQEGTCTYEFPGRWLGGAALVLGPLLLLVGVLLRYPFHFFFPDQLAAYLDHPRLMTAAYSFFAAGHVTLLPAVLHLARRIGGRCPQWAFWGALFAMLGLTARIFHAGADHLAFQLVRVQNLELATQTVADAYGAFHLFKTFNLSIMLGWIVLAIGAYRSRTLKLFPSVALALMASLPLGILKGSTVFSCLASLGLCVALIPFGIRVLREGSRPSAIVLLGWSTGVLCGIGLFYFVGQAG